MTNVLDRGVLVLNKSWQPINVTDAFRAICKVYCDKARIVHSDYSLYTFEEWVENWDDISKLTDKQQESLVRCADSHFMAPEIILLNAYVQPMFRRVKLTRRNIFHRDDNTCQYCGKNLPSKLLNIDHITPKSRGGITSWTNVVVSCIRCNTKKANKTLQQAKLKLLRPPKEPSWAQMQSKLKSSNIPKSWEDFIGRMYWDVTLRAQ